MYGSGGFSFIEYTDLMVDFSDTDIRDSIVKSGFGRSLCRTWHPYFLRRVKVILKRRMVYISLD